MSERYTNWRKARASTNQGGSCVEVARAAGSDGGFGVRDSKQNGRGPVLEFSASSWTTFTSGLHSTTGVRIGRYDHS